MVVVELAGIVPWSVVVVVLLVDPSFFSFTTLQADSDTRTAAARHGMISFFISIIVVWIVTLQGGKLHNRLVKSYGV